jgi:hypothetical protein
MVMSDIRINIDKGESWDAALHRFDKDALWIDIKGIEIGMTIEQARDLAVAINETLPAEKPAEVAP